MAVLPNIFYIHIELDSQSTFDMIFRLLHDRQHQGTGLMKPALLLCLNEVQLLLQRFSRVWLSFVYTESNCDADLLLKIAMTSFARQLVDKLMYTMDHEDIWSALGDHIEISVEEAEEVFLREMAEMASKWEISTSNEYRSIHRVPENIRRVKESAFVPRMVSIGPYYHPDPRFRSTHRSKMMYCKALITRTRTTFADILKLLAAHESTARRFYEDLGEMSSKEFLGMILVDACFIIEYLLLLYYPSFEQHTDNSIPMYLIQNHIKHDLILLENQLPFFILELLYNEITKEIYVTGSFYDVVMSFVAESFQIYIRIPEELFKIPVKHFIDLITRLHSQYLIPDQTPIKQTSDHSELVANATQLHESGVMFRASKSSGLLEINFNNQHLHLTPFELNDEKESLYRNILAFEACHCPKQPLITDYFVFMGTLINDSCDVDLLVQHGVLLNKLGVKVDAANWFKSICAEITHQSAASYLRPVCHQLNVHYNIFGVLKVDMREVSVQETIPACIYRIPENIRCAKSSAYIPHRVSIGPYHHRDARLRSTQVFKVRYCMALIARSKKTNEDILKLLAEQESQARGFYDNPVEMSSKEFLAMILVDACFIIAYLLRLQYPVFEQHFIDLPPRNLIQNHIKHDLILLENQLPFFILELLFCEIDPFSSFSVEEISGTRSLFGLVMSFCAEYKQIGSVIPDEHTSVKHITDLIRMLHIPLSLITQLPSEQIPDSEFTANGTQLYESGVMFTANKVKSLLQITFNNQRLSLTPFELTDEKESLYRNILAFEACHYPKKPFISDYFVFMDTLLDDSRDVALLVQKGVLVNRLGDNFAAAERFNSFCTGITRRSATSYLRPVCYQLNVHYKKPKNTWMTSFRRDHFGTPINSARSSLAILLTLFTLISTVCALISVILM